MPPGSPPCTLARHRKLSLYVSVVALIIASLIIEVPDVALLILGASVVPLNREPLVVGEPAVPPLII